MGGGGEWYRVAGRGCCRERSCAWAVKPGAHDGKLLLHCLLTRSGIIGLARALAGFFAHVLRPREESARCACLARSWGQQRPLRHADWLSRVCTTTPANICREVDGYIHILSMTKYVASRISIILYVGLPRHIIHSQTKMGAGKRRRAFRSRLVSSLRLIPFQTKVGRLVSPISSPHSTLSCLRASGTPACLTPHIDRSIYIFSYACMCPTSVTMLSDKAFKPTSSKAGHLNPHCGTSHRVL